MFKKKSNSVKDFPGLKIHVEDMKSQVHITDIADIISKDKYFHFLKSEKIKIYVDCKYNGTTLIPLEETLLNDYKDIINKDKNDTLVLDLDSLMDNAVYYSTFAYADPYTGERFIKNVFHCYNGNNLNLYFCYTDNDIYPVITKYFVRRVRKHLNKLIQMGN